MARTFICSSTEPIVTTASGKIRGFKIDSTYTFWGIPYATAKRWQMPEPVQPWEGVEDALSYGFVSPMLSRESNRGEIMCPHRYWVKDENCLNLNVWTQSIDPEAKKPVMVWIHGGGFSAGSSIEQVAYDGENLSVFGDCVVVSINHRLNIIGYLDLSQYGEKYWNSANVGNADLVAALQWVHDNIAAFGGDPEKVLIFGQSGGGGKVQSLLQTPAADGLFQRAVIMSGILEINAMRDIDPDTSKIGPAMMAELGCTTIEEMEAVPYEALAAAYNKVAPGLAAQGIYTGQTPIRNSWYAGDARVYGFTEHALTVPTMVGCCIAEMSFGDAVARKHELTDEARYAILRDEFGDKTDALAELFKAAHPTKDLTDLIQLDSRFRPNDRAYIRLKAAGEAPVYNYLFAYEFPINDGKLAWHCSDLAFWFHNEDKVVVGNKPGVSDQLEKNMSTAILNFLKNGAPSAEDLPEWPACTTEHVNTMVLDDTCAMKPDFDESLYEAFLPVAPDPRKRNRKNIALR